MLEFYYVYLKEFIVIYLFSFNLFYSERSENLV